MLLDEHVGSVLAVLAVHESLGGTQRFCWLLTKQLGDSSVTAGTRQAAGGTQSTDRQTLPCPGRHLLPRSRRGAGSCWGVLTQNSALTKKLKAYLAARKRFFFLCYSKEACASLRAFPTSTSGRWHCQLLKQRQGEQHKLCKVLKGSAQCRNHRSLSAGPAKHCRAVSPSGLSSHKHITPTKTRTHVSFFPQ